MADDWKTLRVPKEAYEQAKEQKEANDRTWGEQIVRPGSDAQAGDVDLNDGDGIVKVVNDGKLVGQLTAQGLVEAAELGDDTLSEVWEEKQNE